ncbi:MAG: NADP-dependent oxidoreductase [Brevibacterium sp.]|uniref:NADP-dependent oxidoreductase n=1 Tax=Brevibacterium sandarakinum TaxID=629680 RepID=UPI00265686AC|nr:NADP-dependent oxidoreductase [Brevibacterium sandarakinum]MDN5587860.1 NADP-dependent oxidoreductase [Brevibacterium sp.]MDN5636120.1 NADP-dependent oxidoreductase [Brevibacterium sp.]MDN5658886.1 NADP-dependent oxidoreductase [Brevibacterium sandarakinum]
MTRRVQYTQNGDIDQLHIAEAESPAVGSGQVRIAVRYAGLNPVDLAVIGGAFGEATGTKGNGADFSGVVDSVGDGVTGFSPGDLVFGGRPHRTQTTQLLIRDPAERLDKIPPGLSTEVAGGLYIAGRTAVAGIRALSIAEGETVLVTGASGGVGIIAAQLAANLGARVIGTASEANHALLRSLGIEPIAYGEGLEARLREAAPEGIDAAFSTQGEDELARLLNFDIPSERINSIGAGPHVADTYGVRIDGEATAGRGDLAWLAKAIAYGHVHVPVARVFALDEVQNAYRFLRDSHPAGKVVLRIDAAPLSDEQRGFLGH